MGFASLIPAGDASPCNWSPGSFGGLYYSLPNAGARFRFVFSMFASWSEDAPGEEELDVFLLTCSKFLIGLSLIKGWIYQKKKTKRLCRREGRFGFHGRGGFPVLGKNWKIPS